MDISKYTGYFHDGTIHEISSEGNNIYIFLESAYIDPSEIDDTNVLTKSQTLNGKLSLIGVKTIKVNDKLYKETLTKAYDDGEILDFEIHPNTVLLLIEWVNFPPNPRTIDVDEIEIEAEEIYWENTQK